MSCSRQLADFVCATHFDDIPAPVTARARQLLIDTLGVGQVIERRVAINRGRPDAPLSDAETAKKFSDNVKDTLPQDQARALINMIAALDEIKDIAEVTRALRA